MNDLPENKEAFPNASLDQTSLSTSTSNALVEAKQTPPNLCEAPINQNINSQFRVSEERMEIMENMMKKVMHCLHDMKQTKRAKEAALVRSGTSCIQLFHNFKHDCSQRWVISSDPNKSSTRSEQQFYLAPFASAGATRHRPQTHWRYPNKIEPSSTRRRTRITKSTLSVPPILFPSSANREKVQFEKHPRNSYRWKTDESSLDSQDIDETITASTAESWKPSESESGIAIEDDSPNPSGAKPTFVAMIKTAIRDLIKYKRTTVEAISKYILLRYKVQNDILLQYLLDWMADMNILEKCDENYLLSCRRLVKKTTVAVIRKKCSSRPSRKRGKSKRSSKRRSRSRRGSSRRRKDRYSRVKRSRSGKKRRRKACAYQLRDYNEIRKKKLQRKKARKQAKRGEPTNCKKQCTCRHELTAAKNRVKVKSRYIRRGGKIYKEEEYI